MLFSIKKNRFIIFLLWFVLAGSQYLSGQDLPSALKDTIKPRRTTTISLSDISIKSAELKNKTKQEFHELIAEDAINRLKTKNDQIIASIDHDLLTSIDPADASINIRHLENRKIKLQQELQKIEDQKNLLADIIRDMDDFKTKLTHESWLWKRTLKKMERDSLNTVVSPKLAETILYIDTTLDLISRKSNAIMDILDKTIAVGVEIEMQTDKTSLLISSMQEHAFSQDHPSFFSLDFLSNHLKETRESYSRLESVDLVELRDYLLGHMSGVLITVLFFCGFIYLFLTIKKKVKVIESGYGYFYKEMLLKVISYSFSASVILTLFVERFIFPARPLIFREIIFYLMAFPLIHLMSVILNKRYHVYNYAFGVVIIFYMLLLLFPSEFVLYRVLLLFISVSEIALLSLFLKRYDRKHELGLRQKRLIYLFVFIHLGLALVGLIANLTGRIVLTEIVLSAVFFNIFNGLSLFITVLLINGLIATGIDTQKGQQINVFRLHGELIKRKLISLLNLFAVLYWVVLMLKSFRIKDYLYEGLVSVLTHKIAIGSASFSLDVILIFFALIYVSVMISKLIYVLLEEDVLNRFSLAKGLPHTIATMVKYALITLGFFLAINAAGIPVDKLTLILGAMSVGIGFGLQNVFNNLVSGLILLYERPIQLGDTVQVGQLTGKVKSIGMRSSNIRTFDGAEVIVPNGQLISNEVINWTLSDQKRRIEIQIGVGYNSDPLLVRNLLSQILVSSPGVIQEPPPLVFFSGLGESSLDFIMLFWIAEYIEGRSAKSNILFSVFEVLKSNQIEIPFPQQDIHLRSVEPDIILRNQGIQKTVETEPEPEAGVQ